ncbi:hypothetical protein HMPREF9141_0097 [Prevotella multiformis DSM 16608]|uniref:Uncharacterized protein n=1 Tax=Prevotella multiformis DSM 16608 TaxID=888743 RepID=F0F3D1_9BACT|nr:hypothetical protein HMPREF9141_0097 [Prevotella multiformis DSM 16608]
MYVATGVSYIAISVLYAALSEDERTEEASLPPPISLLEGSAWEWSPAVL